MTGTLRTARLIAAVLVLAGLLVLSGSQCVAEMTAGAHAVHGASPAPAHDTGQLAGSGTHMMPDSAVTADSTPGPGNLGGVLALCLALLLAVLAAGTVRPRRRPRALTGYRPSGSDAPPGALLRPGPGLAQLCVQRV